VNAPVPPDPVAVADPFACPHVAFTVATVALTAVGCVMVTVLVIEHPFASVMVAVYVPAERPVAVAPVPPEGAHT